VLINSYLLFFKGLPESSKTDRQTTASFAIRDPGSLSGKSSTLGEVRGVAGIRSLGSASHGFSPRPSLSDMRFNLSEARGVAGLRTLEQWCQHVPGTIANSDTFSSALDRHGVDRAQAFSLITALKGVFDFRTMRAGENFELMLSPSGNIEKFIYFKSPMLSYQVERRAGKLTGRRVTEQAQVQVSPIALRIKDSLYASLDRAGEAPALVMMIVDIFAWDIDFYIDTYRGDEIRLLVEKLTVNGQFVRYGQILAAEYRGQVGVHRAFRYETADGKIGYYEQDGGSLRKAFLKSPLKFTRISSGYGNRVHPILGFSKMHMGVDLSAPRGTPIWAPGDGTVIFSGRQGVSGNLVTLRHANGYQTIFAHLHTIAPAVRKGSRVIQKQVIGTVGSTGRSTGPHLHYGMKKDGRHVNPFSQRFPPADPVPAGQMKAFQQAIAPWVTQLEAISLPPSPRTASAAGVRKDAG